MARPETIPIPLDVAQGVINYLQRCPWSDVNGVLPPLLNVAMEYNESKIAKGKEESFPTTDEVKDTPSKKVKDGSKEA